MGEAAGALDTAVCEALFAGLEGGAGFAGSRLAWTRFVRHGGAEATGAEAGAGSASALLVVRCEKLGGRLRAQLCLVPLAGRRAGADGRELWTSSLSADALAAHFASLGVVLDERAKAEELTRVFARTLRSKDTVTFEKPAPGRSESLTLSMVHELDSDTQVSGDLEFSRGDGGPVSDLMLNVLLDMSFALLERDVRASKHTEYMLSKEGDQAVGWAQTLERDETPLVDAARQAAADALSRAESDSAAPQASGTPAKGKRRRHVAPSGGPRRKGAKFKG